MQFEVCLGERCRIEARFAADPFVLGRSVHQAVANAAFTVVPGSCPLSRAATHVPNGTSTIGRNENQALVGPVRSGAPRPEPAADGTA